MNLKLVRCGLQHLDELAIMSVRTYGQHYEYLWRDRGEAYMQQEFNKQSLKRHLMNPNCHYFLAYFQDQPAGVLKLNYFSGVLDYPPEICLEIQRIYLLSDYAGKGLGSEIFDQTETMARNKNLRVLWLMAMDSSKASSFYEKRGFQVTQKTNFDHPQIKNRYQGMYVMIKQLN